MHCATVYGALIDDYVGRFNRTLIEHPRYPNKDLCRHVDFKGDLLAFSKERSSSWRKLSERPKPGEIPFRLDGLPAAARFGDAEAVQRLLAQDAKPDAGDDWYVTAIEWAVIRDYGEVLKLMLAVPASQRQELCAALEQAIHYRRPAMVTMLLSRCATQSGPAAANDRNRLINHAARKGDLDLLRAMVAAGFSIDAGPPEGLQEVYWVPEEPEPFRPLAMNDYGEATATTPLHFAAGKGNIEMAETLLKMGAGLNRPGGPWNTTPIYWAIGGGQSAMVNYLLRQGAKLDPSPKVNDSFGSPIHYAIERGNAAVIRVLAEHGVNLNQVARDGQPAIFRTMRHPAKTKDTLRVLLRLGADPNVQSQDPVKGSTAARYPQKRLGMASAPGRTAIMHAIEVSDVACGSWTFGGGAPSRIDPRAPTDCQHKGLPHIELLLAHGAKIGMTDANGHTALHYAARTDYAVAIAELLIAKGADVNARDAAGHTPIDHAKELGLERMPALLARHGGRSARELP